MKPRLYLAAIFILIAILSVQTQSTMEWKGIQLCDFKNLPAHKFLYPDSLFPHAEWMEVIKGSSLKELTST